MSYSAYYYYRKPVISVYGGIPDGYRTTNTAAIQPIEKPEKRLNKVRVDISLYTYYFSSLL